ncbi:hypothetical protein PVAND_010610 [Polypedilum vanderplanki]|uniref:Ig-like domain-containing protein n=1 Tax=Polypedilum vanderplanki TaxID=319348 RepID=A0A9J6CHT6_POLVA|nr:hypothetical protein PVAND_010610 [Polypedilum vanderplanki]
MKLQIILFSIFTQLRAVVQHKPANNEHQMRYNRIDKSHNDAITSMDEHYQQPYFDTNDSFESPNVTIFRDETAYLVCVVRNLGNNSISWIRHNDINLLSVGKFKYTQDPRYQIFHNSHNDTWTLKIRRVQVKDSGFYECQIGISNSQPIGRMIYLKVIDPQLLILEGKEMSIGAGLNLNLTCSIEQALHIFNDEKNILRWSHNNSQDVNHHSPRGVFIKFIQQDETSISHLIIKNLTHSDAGIYKCFTSNEVYASIIVHIENDQSMEVIASSIANKIQFSVTFTTTAFVTNMAFAMLVVVFPEAVSF